MNFQALEMKRTDLAEIGQMGGDGWPCPENFKPVARLTMVVTWQNTSVSDFSSAKKHASSVPATCAIIFTAILAVTAVLGTYYACELVLERVQNMQLLRYSPPQASISNIRKCANPR